MSVNAEEKLSCENDDLNAIWKQVCESNTKTVVKIMKKPMEPTAKVVKQRNGKRRAASMALKKAGPQMLKWTGRASQFLLPPILLPTDAFALGAAVCKDVKNECTRNTVQKGAKITGSLAGGVAGFSTGAVIGTLIFPVIGTVIGGVVGSIAGSAGGGSATNAFVQKEFDTTGYGIDVTLCKGCNIEMKFRKYKGEATTEYCNECRQRPKLEVQYLQQDVGDTDTNRINDESNWFGFYSSAITVMVGEKAMVAMVRKVGDENFEFPNKSECECTQIQRIDAVYYLAAAEKWSENDLLTLLIMMRSDLASLWFLFPEKEELKVDDVIILDKFFNVMKNFLAERHRDNGLQIIGHTNDAFGILWLNATQKEVEDILPYLETICDVDEFHWIVDNEKSSPSLIQPSETH